MPWASLPFSLFHLTKMRCSFLPSGVCTSPPSHVNSCLRVRTKSTFPCGSVVQNPSAKAGYMDSIPALGRSPGGGNDNPLQCSCLGNPMDRGAWFAVSKESDTIEATYLHRVQDAFPTEINQQGAPSEFMLVSILSSAYPPSSMTMSHSVDCGNLTEIKLQLKWLFPVCYILSSELLTNFLWTGIMSYKL